MEEPGRAGEPVAQTSADIFAERLAALRELFPEAFTEGKVDLTKLRAALGEAVDERQERYRFTWAGKQAAIEMLKAPSRAALRPVREESIDFDTTQHLFIEGDNLEVLKLLYKAYFGRVKMIYIDPPYNTGNDFIYPDNFADSLDTYLKLTGQRDGNGRLLTSNPETNGRYHSAWLSMMYPRLFLARQLLQEDGMVFISIDDHEAHNLRLLLNEIFGEENYIDCFVWKKSYGVGTKERYVVTQHEYILLYARNRTSIEGLWLPPKNDGGRKYYRFRDDKFESRGYYRLQPLEAAKSMDRRENLVYGIPLPTGGEAWPEWQWLWSRDRALDALAKNELVFSRRGDDIVVSYKQYERNEQGELRKSKPASVVDGIYTQHGTDDLSSLFDNEQIMQYPKPVALMKLILQVGTDPDQAEIVLDFFAGSATMAHAVLELNREDGGTRRFIMVQLPEPLEQTRTLGDGTILATIANIGRVRIRRLTAKLLADQGRQLDLDGGAVPEDLGMRVFRLAESTMRHWEPMPPETTPDAYVEQLMLFNDQLLPGWQPEDVIWEVALKEGLSLSSTLTRVMEVADLTVWRVTDRDKDQSLLICLDDQVTVEAFRPLKLTQEDVLICRDSALDDVTAVNLALQCRLKTT